MNAGVYTHPDAHKVERYQKMVATAFSEPEPDRMLHKPQAQEHGDTHPHAEEALALCQVADSSLAFDQGPKRGLYARQGISEYYVIDVNAERVFTNSQPLDGRFHAVRTLRSGDMLIPLAFPPLQIAVADLPGIPDFDFLACQAPGEEKP